MESSSNFQLKANALEIIKNYRVPDLQALLKYARLSQQGNKRDLFQRCKILIVSNFSSQLLNKINQIELSRINSIKSHRPPAPLASHPSILQPPTSLPQPLPSVQNLPLANHIQYIPLPFYEKMRTIDCINIPIDWNAFSPLRFTLTDFDVDLILKGLAKVFLRIAPTILSEKHSDVLPPYLLVQCNGQVVISNNIAKTIGSQAHSIVFPTDITDKLIPKSNIQNTLNYLWLQLPVQMSFKNLPKAYTLSIQIVRCISLDSLIDHIVKQQADIKNIDKNNNNNSNNDSDIEIEDDLGLMTTRHRVSLICPITQSLISVPVKSSHCSHLTCFDLRPFLQMNQKRVQWSCPICKKSAAYDTLYVDKRLESIISNVPANCSTVEMDTATKGSSDCQYILDNIKPEKSDVDNTSATSHENVDDDDNNNEESRQQSSIKSGRPSNGSDCIVLSSESENEEEDDLFNSNNIQSFQSLIESNADDESYWNDIAQFTYDLISNENNNNNNNEEPLNLNRKRMNSANSSLLSNDDNHQQPKRLKQSTSHQIRSNDIEIITLSSSDSSDNENDDENQLS